MNKSRIEWCDHTWNPITGCLHDCPYCYAKRIATRFAGDIRLNKLAVQDYKMIKQKSANLYILDKPMLNETNHPLVYPFGFEPTYHRYRLKILDTLKAGKNIFVGAMADVFGDWVPDEWIEEIFEECKTKPQHNYMFLTKNPKRLCELANSGKLPQGENFWWGTTVTDKNCKTFQGRIRDNIFISIEPLCEYLDAGLGSFGRAKLIIIGSETGNRYGKVKPAKEWIDNICDAANLTGAAVFMKDSLIPIVGEENMRRELPEGLLNHGEAVDSKRYKKLYGNCAVCNKHIRKNDMITLLARSRRGESAKSYAYMCKECFVRHCNSLGSAVPDLSNLKESEETK